MPSERVQRRIESLLDEADQAVGRRDWPTVREICDAILRLDPQNEDALHYLQAADRDTGIQLDPASPPAGDQDIGTRAAEEKYPEALERHFSSAAAEHTDPTPEAIGEPIEGSPSSSDEVEQPANAGSEGIESILSPSKGTFNALTTGE